MTAERTEDAGIAGVLQISMGGRVHRVPALKLRHSREWKERLGDIASGIELDDDLGKMLASVANLASDRALDLVVAYDRTGVLGGRDAIEDEATDAELFAALEVMVKATYPFARALRSVAEAFGPQLRELLTRLAGAAAGALSRASSTPTPSATGDSTPTPLSDGSATSSSSSSGPTTNGERPTGSATLETSSPMA